MNFTVAPGVRLSPSLLVLPLAALAAVVVLFINESSSARSVRAMERLVQREQALAELDTVMRRVLDAQTAQRGYMLTERDIYLAPAAQAADAIAAGLAALRRHYSGDATALAQIQEWEALAGTGLDDLTLTEGALDNGRRERWQKRLHSDAGVDHIPALSKLAGALAASERQGADAERRAVQQTLSNSRIGVNAAAAVVFLALLLMLRRTAALDTIQRRHSLAMQAERARLEAEVQHRTADLSELARHLHTVREDESGQLARALHEDLGALLTTAQLEVTRLSEALAAGPPEVQARLKQLSAGFDSGIALKRRIVEGLRPSALSDQDLVSALQVLAQVFGERARVQVHCTVQNLALSDNAQLTAYRLVQESLTNIAKYAQARTVQIELQATGDDATAQLEISDDGRGFDPRAAPPSAHGLMGMRYRVESVGGMLTVTSAPGQGTHIRATLPLLAPRGPVDAQPVQARC